MKQRWRRRLDIRYRWKSSNIGHHSGRPNTADGHGCSLAHRPASLATVSSTSQARGASQLHSKFALFHADSDKRMLPEFFLERRSRIARGLASRRCECRLTGENPFILPKTELDCFKSAVLHKRQQRHERTVLHANLSLLAPKQVCDPSTMAQGH